MESTRRHRRLPPMRTPRPGQSMEPEKLDRLLDEHPAFSVTTVDGAGWIDPYSAIIHPAPSGWRAFARDHLLLTEPWTTARPRAPVDLQVARWTHHLRLHLADDPRLRVFRPDGVWLNPVTGTWEDGVVAIGARVTGEVLHAMAFALACCPAAAAGEAALLDLDTLHARRDAPPAESAAPAAATLQHAAEVMGQVLRPLPELPGLDLALHYVPHDAIGGDFYEVIPLGAQRTLIVLGDVAGHGPEAALVVVSLLRALRQLATPERGLTALLARLDVELRRDLKPGVFVTVCAIDLDLEARTATCVCAGHHRALLLNPARAATLQQLGQAGTALGVVADGSPRTLTPVRVKLEPGDVIVQYTDGIEEAANAHGDEFGRPRAMAACVARLEAPTAATMVEGLVADCTAFAGAMRDDCTVLAVRVLA